MDDKRLSEIENDTWPASACSAIRELAEEVRRLQACLETERENWRHVNRDARLSGRAEVIGLLLTADAAISWDVLAPEEHETLNRIVADLRREVSRAERERCAKTMAGLAAHYVRTDFAAGYQKACEDGEAAIRALPDEKGP